ncbi:hypothetical protein, partial [Lactococcus sp. S64]|uniref:hypothetical protein n=1 Tax=Lactococcus sp. S64 TaxID=2767459 RepID=UPI001F41149D
SPFYNKIGFMGNFATEPLIVFYSFVLEWYNVLIYLKSQLKMIFLFKILFSLSSYLKIDRFYKTLPIDVIESLSLG